MPSSKENERQKRLALTPKIPKQFEKKKKKIPSQITIEMQQRVLLPLGRRKVFSTEYYYLFAAPMVFLFVYE